MSTRHTAAAWMIPLEDSAAKLVLLCLAEHADFGTGECWPSNRRLHTMTGLDERTVRRKLLVLETLGLIRRTLNKGMRGTNLYQLTLPSAESLASMGGWGHAAPSPRALCPSPPGTVPPEPVIEPSEKGRASASARELPDGWWPTEAEIAQAKKDFPDVDLILETNRFIDTNRSKGSAVARPASAWRAWLARGAQFAARDARAAARGGRGSDDRTAAPGLRERLRQAQGMVDDGLPGPSIDG